MSELKREGTCIIIGAGDLTVGSLPYNPDKDYVIAADGGLMYCGVLELEPDLILGDFDSVDDEYAEAVDAIADQIPDKVVKLPVEKDDTDMLAAIKLGLDKGYESFRIYGGMGGRIEQKEEFLLRTEDGLLWMVWHREGRKCS